MWCCLWYFFYVLFGVLATLAAVGGTLMQILGVYSADICYITTEHWMRPFRAPGSVTAVLSLNSRLMLQDARTYWKPCAITAIVFMSVVSFVGWWYQRRMRDMFMELVSRLDAEGFARGDAREARMDFGDELTGRESWRSMPGDTVERHLWGSPAM